MLDREIANVLSDFACLAAARRFAEKAVAVVRSQGQRNELYKSLGRLAEISIKLGDLPGAEQLLSESLLDPGKARRRQPLTCANADLPWPCRAPPGRSRQRDRVV